MTETATGTCSACPLPQRVHKQGLSFPYLPFFNGKYGCSLLSTCSVLGTVLLTKPVAGHFVFTSLFPGEEMQHTTGPGPILPSLCGRLRCPGRQRCPGRPAPRRSRPSCPPSPRVTSVSVVRWDGGGDSVVAQESHVVDKRHSQSQRDKEKPTFKTPEICGGSDPFSDQVSAPASWLVQEDGWSRKKGLRDPCW